MTELPTNILIVEDESGFASVLKMLLTDGCRDRFSVVLSETLSEALHHLRQGKIDVVLLDLSLPDKIGLETYQAVAQAAPFIPVVVLSGVSDEAIAIQAVREGAQDYLVKGQFEHRLLERAIRYAVERKRIERKLREREEFFRLISENITDMIAVVDADGRRIYNSPSYLRLLGGASTPLRTDSFEDIHPEDRDQIRQVFREVVSTGKGRRAEYRVRRGDGELRHIESQSNVIADASGSTERVVLVSRDVSARVRTENDLRQALADARNAHEQLRSAQQRIVQAERLEAVSTFAATVAHEVKNPLQTIVLGIDYLGDSIVSQDENGVIILKQMAEAVEKADAFIRGLLEFSTHHKRELQEHDMGELLTASLAAVEPELCSGNVKLVREFCDDAPLLRLDDRPIRHVLVTLLTHEIQCMGGGEIAVRTFLRDGIDTGKRMLVVDIQGQPHAGAEHDTAMARKMDAQTKFRLMVSKKVLELYGGRVDYEAKDRASRYTISFTT